jgi:putative tricarboxylic transport membrane protein
MLSRDGWAGLAVLAASLVLFGLTLGLKDSPMVPVGPGFYPRIVLGITAVFGAMLLAAEMLARRAHPAATAPRATLNYALVAISFATFGLYVVSLPYLGFRIATVAYVATANATLDPPHGVRGWARVAAIALLTAFITHLIFERYLTVLLPRGAWTGF